MSFVHLHNHSEYSLLDGACRIEELVRAAKDAGMPAVAITDHGAMYGAVSFYKAAKKAGIKGIIGCEVYVAPRTRFDRVHRVDDELYHMTLLVKDATGYGNLMKMITEASINGYYYKPRVDKELLRECSQGLIALSGCLAGQIPRLLLDGRNGDAKDVALEYAEIFSGGNYYLELQDHGTIEEKRVNEGLIRLARETSIPLVATNDVHYIRKGDAPIHDVLLAIQTGTTIDDPKRLKFPTHEFYFKDSEEMGALFDYVPEALENTLRIADKCDFDLELGKLHFPEFQVPAGYSVHGFLTKLCQEGLIQRYGTPSREARERLAYELSIIGNMGYSSYFLIVRDFVDTARQRGIPVGPGRGSAVGSLVAYVLGITNIDPLKYDLLFERFLNPQRVSMPDIDIDFAPEGRDEIIGYVMETYGRDHVAQIITFGTMAARAAIRDVGRAMNIPIPQVDRIVKLLPSGVSLADEEAISKVQELEDLLEQNSKLRTLMRVAGALEGLPRHSSTHASGVVISREPLVQRVPLQRAGDVAITQYAMADIEAIGLLKMDFLGVEELSVLEHTVRLIEKTRGETVDLEEIPLDDERTYELLSQGDTVGVFQLSSELGKRTLRQVKPGIFEDIIATVALVRPGPGAMTPEYVRRKNFGAQVEYPHPSLVPILEETYGIMLYQEQVMQVASVLAGFTLAEADQLRRGMAKKDPKALTALKERFLEGCECRGIHEEVALRIFDSMEYFSGYGFNKSHAAAYARIAYESAYLRANYPTEFMAAALTRERNNYDKLSLYIEDCRRKGIRVEGPDVNESSGEFTPFGDKKIRFGLEAVKNVGRNAVEAIMAGRDKHGRFTSLFDFCEKVDMAQVNKKAIESLIRAGALDSLGAHRAQLLGVYEVAADRGGRLQREKASGQTSLFDLVENPHALGAGEPQLPDIPPFSKRQLLEMEKELLGFYVSGHPLEDMEKLLHMITNVSVAELPNCQDGSQVSIGGILRHVRQLTTKSGKLMSFLNLEGITGNVEVIMFPDVHREFSTYLQPEEAFLVIGRLELRENSIKVIAQSLAPLKDGIVIIKTPSEDGRGELLKLQSTLTHYKGQVPVFLKMGIGEKEALILTTPGSWVLPTDELFSQVKALLGEDAPMYLPSKLAIESA